MVTTVNQDTVAAALDRPGSVSLVYASHKRAGGGYKNHEKGQEEFIARRTDLVTRLEPYRDQYGDNRKPFYILLEGVEFNGTDQTRDLIVSHAPVARLYKDPDAELEKRIIEVCKRVAYYPTFITGPWGGGFFGCDRELALALFEKHATNETVVFAIPS